MNTLVLNNAYMAVGHISWMEAVADIMSGRAEVVETYEDARVRSGSSNGLDHLPHTFRALVTSEAGVWKVPSIIRFLSKAVFPRLYVKFNRHNVWLRDGGQCQYCRVRLKTDEFTFDHVEPSSRGGLTTWENIVVACLSCNARKADRTPQEAGMRLIRQPTKPIQLPGQLSPALTWREGMPESWRGFLQSVRYWHNGLT